MFVKVVLKESTVEFDREYTYAVPAALSDSVVEGACVAVPFGKGNKVAIAYVTSVFSDPQSDFFIKEILSIEEPCPMLHRDQLILVKQMAHKYSCTFGDAIRLMVPPLSSSAARTTATAMLTDRAEAAIMVAEGDFTQLNQLRAVEYLLEYGESLQSDILISCEITRSTLATLRKKKIIEFSKQTVIKKAGEEEAICKDTPFTLTIDQKTAIDKVLSSRNDRFREFLLYGITGSGKTEVYLSIIQKNFELGYGAIMLVPEIALTPQMTARLKARFGDNVRVLHSRMTPKERKEQWLDILSGKARIVAGARSAVFAPVSGLKLVIIDEEQESSYKSETHPRYSAADIAAMRLKESDGVLLLGSATPKVETYFRAQTGFSTLLHLPRRIGTSGLASVAVVDMREELASGNRSIFSRILRQRMTESFADNAKVMLFLNRRGHSGFFLCRDCGHVPKCLSCSVSLTYHSVHKILVCHYCGRIYHIPKTCPVCRSPRIGGFGAGTQQIEEICVREFPEQRVLRMDKDTTTGRGSHARILDEFASGADILIGTQMIAKGHDFPDVTTVGILSADLMLGISDYRASERAFQLITQAAGRAGRGDRPGNVIIQAYNVDDYAVRHAASQDYEGFYAQEILFRKAASYPPFGAIGIIVVSSMDESRAHSFAGKIRSELVECSKDSCALPDSSQKIEIMEMARAPVYKIRDRYRFRIVLKAENEDLLSVYFSRASGLPKDGDVLVSYDINPYQMM
ncbi:MAG: replication restart helicase PriA [Saccharofermentanales bacterium]